MKGGPWHSWIFLVFQVVPILRTQEGNSLGQTEIAWKRGRQEEKACFLVMPTLNHLLTTPPMSIMFGREVTPVCETVSLRDRQKNLTL